MIYNSDATAIALKNISFLICNAGFKFNNCSQRKTNSMPARVCTSVGISQEEQPRQQSSISVAHELLANFGWFGVTYENTGAPCVV